MSVLEGAASGLQRPAGSRPYKKIVVTTFGSYGDLHPYMAMGVELRRRGHDVLIAASEAYREKVVSAGLGFEPVRPDLPGHENSQVFKEIMETRTGTEYLLRRVILPHLGESYEDLSRAVEGADVLISHPTTFAASIVAEAQGIPWVSTVLAPLSFLSVYDTLAIAQAPGYRRVRRLGPGILGILKSIARQHCIHWFDPVFRLRAELGLPPPPGNPIFEGQHSPGLVLALFSEVMGAAQRDWPRQTLVTGFPFLAPEQEPVLEAGLTRFLEDGKPPIVFTLGTLAVRDPRAFYTESASAAARLGRRAVLLVGSGEVNRPLLDGVGLPAGVKAFDYAPYSALFPKACAVVHQGGIGTTAQALRSGRPMLLVPHAHDQPDNAARAVRLGAAREISRSDYKSARVAEELSILLNDPSYSTAAEAAQQRVLQEDGVSSACGSIEELIGAGAGSVGSIA